MAKVCVWMRAGHALGRWGDHCSTSHPLEPGASGPGQSGPSHWYTESPTCGEGLEQIKGHDDSVQPWGVPLPWTLQQLRLTGSKVVTIIFLSFFFLSFFFLLLTSFSWNLDGLEFAKSVPCLTLIGCYFNICQVLYGPMFVSKSLLFNLLRSLLSSPALSLGVSK